MITSIIKEFEKVTDLPFHVMYSLYKYGSISAMRGLAKIYASHIQKLISEDKEILIIGGSSDSLANPMYLLSEYVVSELNMIRQSKVHLTKIHREIRHNEPYCQMLMEERMNLIKGDILYTNDMYKKYTSIILDDVKITGTHEAKIVECIKPDYYIYLAQYIGKNSSIEEELNLNAISGVYDIVNMYISNDLKLQSRNVKYLMNNQNDLNMKLKPVKTLMQEVNAMAYLNGYNHIWNLKDKFIKFVS